MFCSSHVWVSYWEGLTVMVTEPKEDHQRTVPEKGKKPKTSTSHRHAAEKQNPQILRV